MVFHALFFHCCQSPATDASRTINDITVANDQNGFRLLDMQVEEVTKLPSAGPQALGPAVPEMPEMRTPPAAAVPAERGPTPSSLAPEPQRPPPLEPEPPKGASTAPRPAVTLSRGGPPIIIVVNPNSGGNVAGEFLKLPRDGLVVECQEGFQATCFSYPIMDPDKAGFKHLAQEVAANDGKDRIRCIVAGGDGTVMWAIEEIFKAEIPIDSVAIGTVPFGTGNDFGNVTKWGMSGPSPGFLKEKDGFKGLQWYVKAWLKADSLPYDIWEVSVQTHASNRAGFQFIQDRQKKCTEGHMARHSIRRLPGGQLEMSKFVCNYFSFGLDARIGVGFDKMRQKNRLLNKGVYAWEGAKKLLFKKKGVVGQIVESMKELPPNAAALAARDAHRREVVPDGQPVFTTTKTEAAETTRLIGNPVSLIFLNIPSIAGGLDIWNWSARKIGVTGGHTELLKASQDFGDGRLECLSYRTGIGYVLEQLRAPPLSGQGHRVYSGGGPLRLTFNPPLDTSFIRGTAHCKGRTYMQVDGEFFVVHEPDTVVIRHHKTITVLINVEGHR